MTTKTERTPFEKCLLNTISRLVEYYKNNQPEEKKKLLLLWIHAFNATLNLVRTSAELSAIKHACPPVGTTSFALFVRKVAELRK